MTSVLQPQQTRYGHRRATLSCTDSHEQDHCTRATFIVHPYQEFSPLQEVPVPPRSLSKFGGVGYIGVGSEMRLGKVQL